jgi:membrane fusion protein (multidrug efflux system)/multidrug efflux system membrane fusion protein
MRFLGLYLPACALFLGFAQAGSLGCKAREEVADDKARGAGKRAVAFPVEVQPVVASPVEYAVPAVGAVDAFEQVQLTARVAGVIEAVRFREGDEVKKGQVVVEIDPARYNLAVRAARATLDRMAAVEAEAAAGLGRREADGAESVFSKEEVATWRSRASTAGAQVAEAKVALDQAQLNLRDAYVRAPIDGKIQTRAAQTGQYVAIGAALGTLLRRDPLLLRFQVPDTDAARVKVGMDARFRVKGDGRVFTAKLTHVADAADPSTRMVAVSGEIQGEGKAELRPGAFAEVTVPVGASGDAPVIPLTAVRPGERGFIAYVVDGNVARERLLSLGLRTQDGRVEVKAGLAAGERLVVRGAEALRDGAEVRVEPAGTVPSSPGAVAPGRAGAAVSASPAGSAP